MPRIKYEEWKPGSDALATVRQADQICREYRAQGYDLTLRQLYYQFVARGLIPNNQRSYKRLGDVVNRGRMAGLLDWDFIVDRTRNLAGFNHLSSPAAAMRRAADSFRLDHWTDQPTRVEVWVEKEALAGVVGQAALQWDLDYFSCRGYVSQSEQWRAAQRHFDYIRQGQNVVVIHLGDHDPSGIDMSRDIEDRIQNFIWQDWLNTESALSGSVKVSDIVLEMEERTEGRTPWELRRIALNWDQVEQYQPPPNPAKMTDSRIQGYLDRFGDESWELDALDPAVLDALITDEVESIMDVEAYEAKSVEQATHRRLLRAASDRWADVVALVSTEGDPEDEEDEDDD